MNQALYYTRIDSPVDPVWIAATPAGICAVGLGSGQPAGFFSWLSCHVDSEPRRDDLGALSAAADQLGQYFSGTRTEFDQPLDIRGTTFRKSVWAEVALISYGTTRAYGAVARRIGRPGAARAVGGAVGANPLPLLIPCHRVIGAGGNLTGYGGGMEIKVALLRLESNRRKPTHPSGV